MTRYTPLTTVASRRAASQKESKMNANRELCLKCGMVANIDPWLHQQRYRHVPTINRDGQVLVHNGRGAFVAERPPAGQPRVPLVGRLSC